MFSNNLHSSSNDLSIPEEYLCPITLSIILDPVITMDGHTYERSSIELWLETNNTSPVTNEILPNKNMVPNIQLKKIIYEFVTKNKIAFEYELLKAAKENKGKEVKHLFLFPMLNKNITDQAGWSLLHFSAFYGNEELTIFLLEHGIQGNVSSATFKRSDAIKDKNEGLDSHFENLESLNTKFDSHSNRIKKFELEIENIKKQINQKEELRIFLSQLMVKLSQLLHEKTKAIELESKIIILREKISSQSHFNNQVQECIRRSNLDRDAIHEKNGRPDTNSRREYWSRLSFYESSYAPNLYKSTISSIASDIRDLNIFSSKNLLIFYERLNEMDSKLYAHLCEGERCLKNYNESITPLESELKKLIALFNIAEELSSTNLCTLSSKINMKINLLYTMVQNLVNGVLMQNECTSGSIQNSEPAEAQRNKTTLYLIKNGEDYILNYYDGLKWCKVTKKMAEIDKSLMEEPYWERDKYKVKKIIHSFLMDESAFLEKLKDIQKIVDEFRQELLPEILFFKHQVMHLNALIQSDKNSLVKLDQEIWSILKHKYACDDTSTKNSPATLAAYQGHTNILSILFSRGFLESSLIPNGTGNTVLHMAAMNGQNKVVEFLVDTKVDFNAKNNKLQSAAEVAREFGNYNCAELVESIALRQEIRIQPVQIVQLEREMELQKAKVHEEIKEGAERRHLELVPQYRSQSPLRNSQLETNNLAVDTEMDDCAKPLETGVAAVSLHVTSDY